MNENTHTVTVDLPPAELDALVRAREAEDFSFDAAAREVAEGPWNRAAFHRSQRGEPVGERPPAAEFGREAERIAGAVRAFRRQLQDVGASIVAGGRFEGASAQIPRPPSPAERERGLLVPGMLRRGSNTLVVGATHIGKTLLAQALVAAGVAGREFLGRPVSARRWLVVDAENAAADLFEVWTATELGAPSIAESIRLVDRELVAELGLNLADPAALAWLLDQARQHQADAIVLDSLGMLAGVKLTEDQAAAELYRETLKPLAVRGDVGVLLTHHETKYGRAGSDTGYQGAGQVTAQADTVLTMRQTSKLRQQPEGDKVRTHSSVALRQAKNRPRGAGWTEHVDIAGVAAGAEDGAPLLELRVGLKGDQGTPAATDPELFLGELTEPMAPGKLAERLGWNRTGDRFQSTRDALIEAGKVEVAGAGPATRIAPVDDAG